MKAQQQDRRSPHQRAVDNLLDYCRSPLVELDEGKQLAPLLLGRPCALVEDEWELRDKMKALLNAELCGLREKYGIQAAVTSNAVAHLEALKQDNKIGKQDLISVSLVWGKYLCNSSNDELGTACGLGPRRIQQLLADGREQIATLVAQQAMATAVQLQAPRDLPPETPQPAPRPKKNYTEQILVIGCSILSLAIGNLLLRNIPHFSSGLLVAIGGWRATINSVKLVRAWRQSQDGAHDYLQTRLYLVCYALCWAVFCGLAAAIFVNVRGNILAPGINLDRLAWSVTLIGTAVGMLYTGVLDLLDWVLGRQDEHWPFPQLQPYAKNTQRYRWELLGISWLIIVASLGMQIGPHLTLG